LGNAIRNLVVRGAPAIGVSGTFGLALAILQSKAEIKEQLLEDQNLTLSHICFLIYRPITDQN